MQQPYIITYKKKGGGGDREQQREKKIHSKLELSFWQENIMANRVLISTSVTSD
jgi:hypothetical protein